MANLNLLYRRVVATEIRPQLDASDKDANFYLGGFFFWCWWCVFPSPFNNVDNADVYSRSQPFLSYDRPIHHCLAYPNEAQSTQEERRRLRESSLRQGSA